MTKDLKETERLIFSGKYIWISSIETLPDIRANDEVPNDYIL